MTGLRHAHDLQPAPVIPPAAVVLGDRPLRPGADRARLSRFADTVWELNPAEHQAHNRALMLNFATVPARFEQATKELLFALLAGPPPPGERELRVDTIRGVFTGVRVFLHWADRRGITTLAEVTLDDLAAYQQHLLTTWSTASWRGKLRRSVRLFWLYRARPLSDRLLVDPAHADGWEDDTGHTAERENRTERIPEPVLGPLLGWALRWVEEFADDVLDVHAEWRALYANTTCMRARRGAPSIRGATARLAALLDRYRAEGRPLPGRDGMVNFCHLGRELDCHAGTIREGRPGELIAQAAAELGVADGTWLRTVPRALLAGRPWHGPVGYDQAKQLERLLHTACYIVIAYLSGMRDSEKRAELRLMQHSTAGTTT